MRSIQPFLLRFPIRIFLFLLLSVSASGQFYNGYEMEFGKNRVQYDDRFWTFMKFKNFDTYYYLGGLELAAFTGRTADKDLEEIEKLFDYKLDGRIQFIIYNKLSEAKQSNIGLETEETANNNIGGVTRIVGNKVFLYFTGNHEEFHRQIRAGIARVLTDQIMYGGDVKDRIQNSALLTLPDWYLNGLISYVARSWDAEIDNRVRDGIISGRYRKFNHLTGTDALYAGHSVWKYIIDTYSESSVSNLLYMTRINRNVESGFNYVLGLSMRTLTDNWRQAMMNLYASSDAGRDSIGGTLVLKRTKPRRLYNQLQTSADGRYSVYVMNDIGRYKVMLFDDQKHRTRRILRGGYRSYSQETDLSYPVLAWHPTGQLIGIIRERKGFLWYGTYTLETGKYEEGKLFNFEKVLGFSYSDDGQSLVISGVQKGQSDIFVYNLRTRTYFQVTKDLWDDLHPRFYKNSTAIVFSSNRNNDTLGVPAPSTLPADNNLDIFYYDYAGKASVLRRLTSTPYANEIMPMPYDSTNIAYLSDENGIVNRYTAHLDSAIAYVDTVEHYRMIVDNFAQTDNRRNILSQDIDFSRNRVSEIVYFGGKYRLLVNRKPQATAARTQLGPVLFRAEEARKRPALADKPSVQKPGAEPATPATVQQQPVDSNKVDINNYVFQSDFPKKRKERKKEQLQEENQPATPRDSSGNDVNGDAVQFLPGPSTATQNKSDSTLLSLPKQRNYDPAFSSSYFVSQLDNTLLNQTYQIFTGGGEIFFNPGLNGFFKLGIRDLLEDYRITGGFRLSGDLNSNEYYMSYENLKKRLDKQYTFYRGAILYSQFGGKLHTHEARVSLKWPFSEVASIRGSLAYRNDRFTVLATDYFSLIYPSQSLNWATGKLEYVFDNTLPTGLNLYNGTRLKFFGEYWRQVDTSITGMFVLGGDVRHYQKLHREIIWANRVAGGTSFGEERLIHFLGGTDNWITPRFNYDTPIDFSQNYYYQALATNMRGFQQNIRNGNSFVVINSEVRVPIFRYLLNRPIKSDFIRNFQVVGFGDIGTAWNGASPYDSTNALNNRTLVSQPFVITLISQREPIVGGFGFGLRSRLLGYFIRADWAWGVEDQVVQPRRFYFSLGLDF